MHIPKRKSFGQHFLHEKRVIQTMVAALKPADTIVEVGPGDGAITRQILTELRPKQLVLIEADPRLIPSLKSSFPNAEIMHADAATIDYGQFSDWSFMSNLPYNAAAAITTQVLRTGSPKNMVIMTQKEQAQRMLGMNGMSMLTLAIQLYAAPKKVMHVGRGAFNPPPNVDSMVIALDPLLERTAERNEKILQFAKYGFASKRKQLQKNLLAAGFNVDQVHACLKRIGKEQARAEELSIQEWELIAACLDSRNISFEN